MYPLNLPEEELKSKVAADFFNPNPQSEIIKLDKEQKALLKTLDSTQILGRIDFCISYNAKTLFQPINFLWAEAKKGNKADIIESFIQLILTIGKEKTYENNLPPIFLGAFDCEKIAFIPYHELDSIFTQNDFNWNVTPSNHDTKEFKTLHTKTKELLESKKLQFSFKSDTKELQSFIQANFTLNNENIAKIPITKNNFTTIYQKWLLSVAPSIGIDWNLAKNAGILDADFYLADLLSAENQSLLDKLFVVLKQTHYEFNKTTTFMGTQQKDTASFNDNQKAHTAFWNLYERPPKEEYWSYIIDRRDLLVPSDIRERKGAFFTPQTWVSKAQSYLEKALGENYQSEYYIWDCAAGTGNLLTNLTESHRLYASTLDKADVEIMQELSSENALHLLPKHIFQFDFLNDEFFDKPCDKHATPSHTDSPSCHTERSEVSKNTKSKRDFSFATQTQSEASLENDKRKKIQYDKVKSKLLQTSLFNDELDFIPTKPLIFSDEAKEVLQAGKEIFKHYHTQAKDSKDYNPNAAIYDIKAHFQGFNDKGKMNSPQKAKDVAYKEKLGNLNYALKDLAKKLESKIYEYEFLLP